MSISPQQVKSRFQEYLVPDALKGVSSGAFGHFEKLGFPDRKNENWKRPDIFSKYFMHTIAYCSS